MAEREAFRRRRSGMNKSGSMEFCAGAAPQPPGGVEISPAQDRWGRCGTAGSRFHERFGHAHPFGARTACNSSMYRRPLRRSPNGMGWDSIRQQGNRAWMPNGQLGSLARARRKSVFRLHEESPATPGMRRNFAQRATDSLHGRRNARSSSVVPRAERFSRNP